MHNSGNSEKSYLYCWGFGKYGQIGGKFYNYSLDPLNIDLDWDSCDDEIFQIYSGESHNAILTFNNSLYTFGKNVFGQWGLNSTNYVFSPTITKFPTAIQITKVSLGGEHTIAKSDSNLLFTFGWNVFGQLGSGDFITRITPYNVTIPSLLDNEEIIDISAGAQHSMLLTNKNRIFTCGFGKSSAWGLSVAEDTNVFTNVDWSGIMANSKNNAITKIVCSVYHSAIVYSNNKSYIIWGVGEVIKYPEPTSCEIKGMIINNKNDNIQIKDLKLGEDFLIILTTDDKVYSYGTNASGQLGIDSTGHSRVLTPYLNRVNIEKVQQISVGYEHVMVMTYDKKIYGWGNNQFGQLSLVNATSFIKPTYLEYLSQLDGLIISCGGYHNIGMFSKYVKNTKQDLNENENKSQNDNTINLDIFRNNLNVMKLSSTLRKDIPPIINKIKILESVENKLEALQLKRKELDAKIEEYKAKDQKWTDEIAPKDENLSKWTRGFENTFEIKLEEIEITDNKDSVIGKGTFGEVKRGIWRGEEVAIKFLKTSMLNSDESIRAFVEECNIMKNLHHPNILLYMGACTKGPEFFVWTEYCENGNWFELLHIKKNVKLSWDKIRRIALEIAYGVNYLHNFHPPVLHRDLKSMNVLLDKNYQVKWADFGNTKFLDVQMTKQKGTFQWMAPEVIKGNVYTEKSDIFSFGIIMNEWVTRLPPYQGINKKDVAKKVVGNPLYRPELNKKIPKDWWDLMVSCYDDSEKKRPSFNEVIDCLKKAKWDSTATWVTLEKSFKDFK